jgi:hypothetical protein
MNINQISKYFFEKKSKITCDLLAGFVVRKSSSDILDPKKPFLTYFLPNKRDLKDSIFTSLTNAQIQNDNPQDSYRIPSIPVSLLAFELQLKGLKPVTS